MAFSMSYDMKPPAAPQQAAEKPARKAPAAPRTRKQSGSHAAAQAMFTPGMTKAEPAASQLSAPEPVAPAHDGDGGGKGHASMKL